MKKLYTFLFIAFVITSFSCVKDETSAVQADSAVRGKWHFQTVKLIQSDNSEVNLLNDFEDISIEIGEGDQALLMVGKDNPVTYAGTWILTFQNTSGEGLLGSTKSLYMTFPQSTEMPSFNMTKVSWSSALMEGEWIDDNGLTKYQLRR